jgi:hypothetical protein
MDLFGLGSSRGGAKTAPVWGVAAMLVVSVLVAIQARPPVEDEAAIYRGDSSVTILIVDKPLQRANELLAALKPLAGSVDLSPLAGGKFHLRVQDSEKVRDYLATQRIEPNVVGGYITIDVVPKKK